MWENCPELEFGPAPFDVYAVQLDLALEDGLETCCLEVLLSEVCCELGSLSLAPGPEMLRCILWKKQQTVMKIDSLSLPWPSEHPEYNCSDSLSKHFLKEHFSLMLTFPFFHSEYPQMFSHDVYVMWASDWREQFFPQQKNWTNWMK